MALAIVTRYRGCTQTLSSRIVASVKMYGMHKWVSVGFNSYDSDTAARVAAVQKLCKVMKWNDTTWVAGSYDGDVIFVRADGEVTNG